MVLHKRRWLYRSSPIRSASDEMENNEKKILISFHSDFSVEEDGSRSNSMRNNEGEASSSTTKVGRGARGRRRGSTTKQPRPSNLVVLWTAVRPHTLTASLCPCFVAMAATVAGRRKDGSNNGGGSSSTATTAADWDIACLWTLFCLCVQIGVSAFSLDPPPFFRPLFFSFFQ